MRILVLSDSHAGLSFMRYAIAKTKPDAVVHLGDYFDDGETMAEEFPQLIFHLVPGNCDRGRIYKIVPEMLCYKVCAVTLYMTHGHNQHVKMGLGGLLADARRYGAQAVLYGHTHCADCHQEEDGLWVINPGSCGSFGGSVALLETKNETIISCAILCQEQLEEML